MVFDLPQRFRFVSTDRPEALILTPPITLSLVLATVLQLPSLLQLQSETQRRGWQRLARWAGRISDDAFA